ncbi:MAG: hypothetical protein AAGC84_10725 [Pseudomonas sp.]
MDRVLAVSLCLCLALLAGCAHRYPKPGANEYLDYMAAQAKADSVVVIQSKPSELLQTSADQGFAPAQFELAKQLRSAALQDASNRASLNAKSCDLLKRAAASDLLIAALSVRTQCADASLTGSLEEMLKAADDGYAVLTKVAARQDPYGAFYPIKALEPVNCVESPSTEDGAVQPPMLTLAQARAEALYTFAMREAKRAPAVAKQLGETAFSTGCSAKAYAQLLKMIAPQAAQ